MTEKNTSPLNVTYDEVQANPYLCKDNPLMDRPDIFGNIVLWEGRQSIKDKTSAMYRVLQHKPTKLLKFQRFDKRTNEWVAVQELPKRRFFRRKVDRPAAGVIRHELFQNPDRVVITEG